MKNNCNICRAEFLVTEVEKQFLQKVSPIVNNKVEQLPLPILCVGCREQSRLAYRNEFHFFKRSCAKSGKQLVSIYDPSSRYVVYDPVLWWSDDYDPLEYGRDFDFSKTFFENFNQLNITVPKAAIQNFKSENSAYTNYSSENKNCYLCAGSSLNEDCYYCSRVVSSKSVCDSYNLYKSENCYSSLHGSVLYGCAYCQNCHNSFNLILCDNCIGCNDCFACTDLQNIKYCIYNQQYSKEDYQQKLTLLVKEIDQIKLNPPKSERTAYLVNCEDSTGDQLVNCSRCKSCFGLKESQDCMYLGLATKCNDCIDSNFMDRCELQYYSTNLIGNYRVLFSALVWYTKESMYLLNCFNSNNLFACSGMKRNEYCVLNKSYTKLEYHALVQKIIAHMKETNEWGRYFPLSISPFPYNHSVSQEYYPLEKRQALSMGLSWHEEEDTLEKSPDDQNLRVCTETGKPFKVIKQEQELCSLLGISLPVKCPEARRNEMIRVLKRALAYYA